MSITGRQPNWFTMMLHIGPGRKQRRQSRRPGGDKTTEKGQPAQAGHSGKMKH